jgi:hypothetical protein
MAAYCRDETGIGVGKTLLREATGFKHGMNLHYRGLLAQRS